jgi:aldose 1-epimerase
MSAKILQNDHWQVGILPETGGSIAFGKIKVGDRWLDLMRPTPENSYHDVESCASFILIPWASRLGDAQFSFQGTTYSVNPTNEAGWAMHGVGRNYPWRVVWFDSQCMTLSFNSSDFPDVNFPFAFSASVDYAVEKNQFSIKTTIRNEDCRAMPAGFGHHPYFQRSLSGPTEQVEVEIPCKTYFDLSAGVPTIPPQPIPSRLDFTQARPLGSDPIDDCLTGRDADKPIRLIYPETGKMVTFSSDPIFEIVIFYAPVGTDYFAVEPITHATDGFNLYDKGIPGSGIFVLEPGESKTGIMALSIE